MTSSRRSSAFLAAFWLGLAATGCGDDDSDAAGGDTFPPAIGAEDCASSTSELTLTQPPSADVWGGLTLLEFEVEGASVDQFDVQYFDSGTNAWITTYSSYQGQRDDGTYALGVTITPNEAGKDGDFKLRVRPAQQGCPDSDWAESEAFNLVSPFEGTSWQGSVPPDNFSGAMTLQRQPLDPLEQTSFLPISLAGDVEISISLEADGTFTQVTTVPLGSEAGEPFDDCTLKMTFKGSWSSRLDRFGMRLALAGVELVEGAAGLAGSSCEYPALADLAAAADTFTGVDLGSNQLSSDIDYLPTLYDPPGAPVWTSGSFPNVVGFLPQIASYANDTEIGGLQGSFFAGGVTLERD